MRHRHDLTGQDSESFNNVTATSYQQFEMYTPAQHAEDYEKQLTKDDETLGITDLLKSGPDDDQKKDANAKEGQKKTIGGITIPECLVPNKKLISIKMHYFWYSLAGGPIWMFLPLILRQRGVSAEGIGLISSINPAITVFVGFFFIYLIDRFKAHRVSFIVSTTIMPTVLAIIYWIPHVSVGVPFQGLNTKDPLWNATDVLSPSAYEILSVNQSLLSNTSDTLSSSAYEIVSLNATDTVDQSSHETSPHGVFPRLDNATEVVLQNVLANNSGEAPRKIEYPVKDLVHMKWFWVLLVIILLSNLSFFVNSNLTDSICFMKLGNDDHLYGQQRLFSAISWGFCAIFTGSILDLYSLNLPERDYFPSFLMVVTFGAIDVLLVNCMNVPEQEKAPSDQRPSARDIFRVMLVPKNFLFLVTLLMLSISHVILSTFHMLLVEDVANAWEPNFSALRTLQGLLIVFRCLLGEVPVFICSGDILLKIGVTGSLVLVLVCHAIRYVLYYTITNPWFFLPVELFHGINYGLYKATISYKANEMAPTGTTSTMLAIVKIVQFVGKIISGVTAGAIWSQVGGHSTFLFLGLFLIGYNILYTSASFLLKICCHNKTSDSKEMAPVS
ncbi:major facilitator superfamily domain-containing protein 6-like [Oratosquilla oratoria]|uniref:major facilitator superfamily domain-containing protein 6-like n=1 Tax=Oratosquilla oratoria TaxID=337810 RepID=UPI003F77757B